MKIQKNINKNQRIEYIDLLRIIATLAVIVIHVSAQNWYSTDITSYSWNLFNIYDSISRWAVPIFVMISGTLILSKEYDIKTIYSKKILRLFTAFLFWSLLYALVKYRNDGIFTIITNFFKGNYHMWFIFMIMGLYMLSPILKKITELEKICEYFLIICFLISSVLPQISNLLLLFNNKYLEAFSSAMSSNIENLKLSLGYAGYFVLGYYLNNKNISKKTQYIIYGAGLLGFVSTVLLTNIASTISNTATATFYNYLTVNVTLESICLFVFAKYNFKTNKLFKYISTLCFGIYLIHILIIDNLNSMLNLNTLSFNALFSVPVISILVFLISLLLSGIINKIPIIKKYIV
ncbi:MAG: acyltransferase family protein [Clostridia bacterium]|nr:acyltransferase family protein [Clostridia bacterium]